MCTTVATERRSRFQLGEFLVDYKLRHALLLKEDQTRCTKQMLDDFADDDW